MNTARRVFFWAGVYGIVVLLPQYFLEAQVGLFYPPAITHPENYYGFIGLGLAWQAAFIIISTDVGRFRPLMLAAAAEKFLFVGSTLALILAGRVAVQLSFFVTIDLLLGALFVWGFRLSRPG
mgnify:CR=1 FL=1